MILEKIIILLFWIKPSIDLFFWNKSILTIGRMDITLLHVVAVSMFIFLWPYVLKALKIAPLSEWMIALLFLHIMAFLYSYTTGIKLNILGFISVVIRIADSFIIYFVFFSLSGLHKKEKYYDFFKAVFGGTAIAVFINTYAIYFGFARSQMSQEVLRISGLYHDPGVLSNLALYNLIFASILLLLSKSNKMRLLSMLAIFIDLYLIYQGVSRTVIIQLVVYSMIYFGLLIKGFKKLIVVYSFTILVGIVSFMSLDFDKIERRFATEEAIVNIENYKFISSEEEFSIEEFQGVGTNRVKRWIRAFENIMARHSYELFFGNFSSSKGHSDYLDVLSRTGIVGLIIYLYILSVIWIRSFRLYRRSKNESMIDRVLYGLSFSFITLFMLYALAFRPLMYTTTAWYMWATFGMAFGRDYWIAKEQQSSQTIKSHFLETSHRFSP